MGCGGDGLSAFICRVVDLFIQPLIVLVITAGVAYFIFLVAYYIYFNSDKPEKRSEGFQVLMWGVIGIFIMVSAIGLIRLALNTFGIQTPG